MRRLAFLIAGILMCLSNTKGVQAQAGNAVQETVSFEAKVVQVIEDREIEIEGAMQPYQKLELVILEEEAKGKIVTVENGNLPLANVVRYKTNDKVVVSIIKDAGGNSSYVISDSVRRDSLTLLFIIFLIMTVLVTKIRGIMAMLSMGVSFAVIYYFILPQISQGSDPVLIAILGSVIIIPVTFYMSHGINKKTTVAVAGTLMALAITGLLAKVFIELSYLYGLSSDEAAFLSIAKQGTVNMKGILLAGIVIGALGVLDDITVSQAGIVEQLKGAAERLKPGELFARAMKVGQDHVTSMVNTLVLVYAGASLPLLLIFIDNPQPFGRIINHEFVAEEVVRTLVGSIGLIAAVPITTFIASLAFSGKTRQQSKQLTGQEKSSSTGKTKPENH